MRASWKSVILTSVLLLVTAACQGDEGGADDGGDSGGEPIVIGLAAARTGELAPYDLEPAQAFELRAKEINDAGGILGRPVEVIWRDTRSDPATSATVALELIDDGADIIIWTCDFDYGSPAAFEAQTAGIVNASLCASDPKSGDRTTIGDLAFSMDWGTHTEAALMAEWAYNNQGWRTTYLFQDDSLNYSLSVGSYFRERFEDLGGTIVDEGVWTAGENVDIGAQVTSLRSAAADVDFITLPSWNPGAATAIRQIRAAGIDTPILGAAAIDGTLLTDIAGPISDFYYIPYVCLPSYCSGESRAELDQFVEDFEAETGNPPTTFYAVDGYDLMSVLALAIEEAETTDGSALAEAITNLPPTELLAGLTDFPSDFNMPVGRDGAAVEVANGEFQFVERITPQEVPDPTESTG